MSLIITFKIHKLLFKMSFFATCFSLMRPSSSKYQFKKITSFLSRCLDDAVSIDVIQFRGQKMEIWGNNFCQKRLKYRRNTP
jgi:hypothetical protein